MISDPIYRIMSRLHYRKSAIVDTGRNIDLIEEKVRERKRKRQRGRKKERGENRGRGVQRKKERK